MQRFITIESRNLVNRLIFAIARAAVVINLCLTPIKASAETAEIGSVTVMADARLAVVLSRLIPVFADQSMTTVTTSFGQSVQQVKKIEDGESADLFITSDPQMIQQLKNKGLVDVYTVGRIASQKEVHYVAAVVAGENMNAGRKLLAFLRSAQARPVFKENGLTVP